MFYLKTKLIWRFILMGLLKKLSNNNKKHLKRLRARALQIDALKDTIAALSDDELKAKTKEFQEKLSGLDSLEAQNEKLDERKKIVKLIKKHSKVIECKRVESHDLNNYIYNYFKENNYKIVHSHINTLSIFPLRIAKKVGVPIRIAHRHSTTNKAEWKKNLMKLLI